MGWNGNHSKSERLASQAEAAAREGNRERASALYREAAEAECRAVAAIDPTKIRTLGITAVSAVSLYYKAGERAVALDIGHRYLDAGSLPEFAQNQVREILDVIRRERLDEERETARVQVNPEKKHIPAEVAAHRADHFADDALTEREIEVLRQVAGGNRNRDIAVQLFISEETVKVHIKHIMEKLAASDRIQAVAIAVRRGIIQV